MKRLWRHWKRKLFLAIDAVLLLICLVAWGWGYFRVLDLTLQHHNLVGSVVSAEGKCCLIRLSFDEPSPVWLGDGIPPNSPVEAGWNWQWTIAPMSRANDYVGWIGSVQADQSIDWGGPLDSSQNSRWICTGGFPPRWMAQSSNVSPTGSMLTIPWWLIVLPLTLAPAVSLIGELRRVRVGPKGHCPSCGYDWRATPGRCPECGYGQDRIGK